MRVPWRLVLGFTVLSGVLIEILDNHLGVRNARFVVWIVLVPSGMWIASRRWTAQEMVTRWAKSRGLEANASTAPELERYLQRQRKFNVSGGALAFFIALSVDKLTPLTFGWAEGLLVILPLSTVILAAQMIAERTFVPVAGGEVRRAQLVARRLTDYVPEKLVVSLRALGVVALAIPLIAVLLGVDGGDTPLLWGIGIAGAAYVVAVELSQRWRTRWPRPFESVESVHFQDVLRSDAIRMAMWGGVIGATAALAAQLIVLTRDTDGAVALVLPLAGIFGLLAVCVAAYRTNVRGFALDRQGSVASG